MAAPAHSLQRPTVLFVPGRVARLCLIGTGARSGTPAAARRRPDLPGIRVAILAAAGEADALTFPALASGDAAGIPGALLRIVAGAGHLPPLEQPE